jgi:hypothetical protein
VDPLFDFNVNIQSFDVPRIASVFPDNVGIRWWTTAWFNNRANSEKVIPITREQAIKLISGEIGKDAWLQRFFPKQMSAYHAAIEQSRRMLLGL